MILKQLCLSILVSILLQPPLSANVTFDLTTAKMTLNDDGHVSRLQLPEGTSLPAADYPSFKLSGTYYEMPYQEYDLSQNLVKIHAHHNSKTYAENALNENQTIVEMSNNLKNVALVKHKKVENKSNLSISAKKSNTITDADSITFFSAGIIVAPKSLDTIAIDLADLIKQSAGFEFSIQTKAPNKGKYISLSLGCEVGKDGFIQSSPNYREIAYCAKDKIGLTYAATDFAERYLGKHWLFPAENELGTYTPHVDKIIVSREKRVNAPAYENRRYYTLGTGKNYQLWASRMRMLSSKSRFNHNLNNLFPIKKYYKTNPEFYPIHNRVRYPSPECVDDESQCPFNWKYNWQPILTAPGLLEEGVKYINTFFDVHPSESWYSLGMNDSSIWGDFQMEEHPKNSAGHVYMSDYFFTWANKTATKVRKTHPNKKLGVLAYNSLIDPPKQKVHKNLVPYITFDRMQWIDNDRKAYDQALTKNWEKKATELGWWDYVYGDSYYNVDLNHDSNRAMYIVPRVYPHLMAEYLRFGRDHNVKHYFAEAVPEERVWREGPKLYVLSKLLWNPDLDVDTLLDDWYKATVGPAASSLKAYFDFWEDFWMTKVPKTPWFKNNALPEFLNFTSIRYIDALTLQDRDYLQGEMGKLLQLTRGTEFETRARFFYHSWIRVKKEALGDRLDFSKGIFPEGYQLFFNDPIEGVEGSTPANWSFWIQPDVNSEVSGGLTSSTKKEGDFSFKVKLKPDGKHLAQATLHRLVEIPKEHKKHTRFCARIKVLNPSSNFNMKMTFKKGDIEYTG
ncbi:MAG TPA: DUF4838 domain-containing protein, partial [bacterium (Candidatus Stahlbacteria)]|nr:DUF4838 domain-containing protein [Candidatus Stahlbacteria bacterium]